MGNHSIYSPGLQADVILDTNEMSIFSFFTKQSYKTQSVDPKDYVGLSALGYMFQGKGQDILNSGHAPQIEQVTKLRVKPDLAEHARGILHNRNQAFLSKLLIAAIPQVSLDAVKEIEKRNFATHLAIIIAAFPQKEARMAELWSADLQFVPEAVDSNYDAATLSRLYKALGTNDMARVIRNLDAGFTEQELMKFGFLVPYLYTPEQIRATTARPIDVKNILNVFLPNIMYNSRSPQKPLFTPTFNQVESIIASGVKTAKRYKDMAVMRGRKVTDRILADEIPVILNAVSFDDAKEIHERSGPIWVEEIVAIAGILEAGHTLDDYFEIVEAIDPETERGMRLEISPSYNILGLLERGLSVKEVSQMSHEGIPLFQM